MWIIRAILNLLLPENCLGCGAPNTYLCKTCMSKMEPSLFGKDSYILAATSYQNPTIKKAIRALKYRGAKKIALPLAQLTETRLRLSKQKKDSVIIPVPMAKKRKRKRSFNQAEEIGKNLSDITGIPHLTNVLYKNKETVSQVKIKNRAERLKNLKNCFSVKNPELIKNKNIFVLDDVCTTGATIKECRETLMKNGARRVTGVVVAAGN